MPDECLLGHKYMEQEAVRDLVKPWLEAQLQGWKQRARELLAREWSFTTVCDQAGPSNAQVWRHSVAHRIDDIGPMWHCFMCGFFGDVGNYHSSAHKYPWDGQCVRGHSVYDMLAVMDELRPWAVEELAHRGFNAAARRADVDVLYLRTVPSFVDLGVVDGTVLYEEVFSETAYSQEFGSDGGASGEEEAKVAVPTMPQVEPQAAFVKTAFVEQVHEMAQLGKISRVADVLYHLPAQERQQLVDDCAGNLAKVCCGWQEGPRECRRDGKDSVRHALTLVDVGCGQVGKRLIRLVHPDKFNTGGAAMVSKCHIAVRAVIAALKKEKEVMRSGAVAGWYVHA